MSKKTIILFNSSNQYTTLTYRILSINHTEHQIIILQKDQTNDRQPTKYNLQKIIKRYDDIIFINFGHYFSGQELLTLFEKIDNVFIMSFAESDPVDHLDLSYKIKNKKLRLNKIIKFLDPKPVTKVSNAELDKLEVYPYPYVESFGENDSSNLSPNSENPYYVRLDYERQTVQNVKHVSLKNIVSLLILNADLSQFASTIGDLFSDLKVTLKNFCDQIIIDHGLDIILEASFPLDLDSSIG